jgi:hypothetical protein
VEGTHLTHNAAVVFLAIAIVLALVFYFPRANTGNAPVVAPQPRPVYQPSVIGFFILAAIIIWII